MKLIVGLGNPGQRYGMTRHNMGFLVLDRLASDFAIPVQAKGFDAIYGKGHIGPVTAMLAKPQTYMNRSGLSVARLFDYFKIIQMEDLIVVHDDLDLPFGAIRLKAGGGHGGHKGVQSIQEHLGRSEFLRVRLGIGHPTGEMSTEDYVLGRFTPLEMKFLPTLLETAGAAVADTLSEGLQKAMNKYHARPINYFNEEV